MDPDLGSPNRHCPGGGPGKGKGGRPDAPFPNCMPQGNLLIIQNSNASVPNDSPDGGCMMFEFRRGVNLVNIGLLDVEESASITVRTPYCQSVMLWFYTFFPQSNCWLVSAPFWSQTIRIDETTKTFASPKSVGDNGFWQITQTQPEFSQETNVQRIELCLRGSGGVSFLNYIDCNVAATPTPTMNVTTSPSSQPVASLATMVPAPTPAMTPMTSPPAPTPCSAVKCDFSTLQTGVELGEESQRLALRSACMLEVSAVNTIENNVVNVFDSSVIIADQNWADPDLGSPNRACPDGGGPGKGNGGKPDSPHPNCEAQGKLLIIQNEDIAPVFPNDSIYGGCLVFNFTQPVTVLDMGIMDIGDDVAVISITMANGRVVSFDSPSNVGHNGLWKVKGTYDLSAFDGVTTLEMCLAGPGAVSFIEFLPCNS
jgi:hypothetical protein